MTGDGTLLQRIEVALAGSTPTPVERALQNLSLPGDLPGEGSQAERRGSGRLKRDPAAG